MTKTRGDADVRAQPYLATLLTAAGGRAEITELFDRADLTVGDFYRQLAWEVQRGLIIDDKSSVVTSAPAAAAVPTP